MSDLVSFPASKDFESSGGNNRGDLGCFLPSSPAFPEASFVQISLNYTALMYGEAISMQPD